MAQSGRARRLGEYPLLGEMRTSPTTERVIESHQRQRRSQVSSVSAEVYPSGHATVGEKRVR
jgi:hypothetical protein